MTHKRNTLGFSEHNEELHDATIEAIEESFKLLMKEKPYEKISVADIVKKAGVSRSAFYRNYETKDALLESLISVVMDEINDMTFGNTAQREYWIKVFEIVYDNRSTFEMFNKTGKSILDYFSINVASQEYFLDREGIWVIRFMRGAFIGLIEKWCEDGFKETPEEMLEIMYDTIGILAKEYDV